MAQQDFTTDDNTSELQRLNRLYNALRLINRAIIHSKSSAELFEEICRIAVEDGDFLMAWIGLVEPDGYTVTPVASWGDTTSYLSKSSFYVGGAPEGLGPTGQAIKFNRIYVCNNFFEDPSTIPWREKAVKAGIRASASIPILSNGTTVGALTVYSSEMGYFKSHELGLLVDASAEMAYAIENLHREVNLRRHAAIVESSTDAVMSACIDGTITTWNKAAEAMFGHSAQEAIGKNLRLVVPPDKVDEMLDVMARVTAGQSMSGFDTIRQRRDGSTFDASITISTAYDADGSIIGASAICRDITAKKQNEEQLRVETARVNTLRSIDIALSSARDSASLMDTIVKESLVAVGVTASLVFDTDLRDGCIKLVAGSTRTNEPVPTALVEFAHDVAQAALNTGEPVALETPHRLCSGEYSRFGSVEARPLHTKMHQQGVFVVFRDAAIPRPERQVDFLNAVAMRAGMGLDTLNLFQDLKLANSNLMQAYEETLEGLVAALELRDHETEGHSRRVMDMTTALAKALGLRDDEVIHIRRGALLHDIGKIGVSDAILNKPDRLTPEEWIEMKSHVEFGKHLLERIAFLRPALDIPSAHHERWDGSGYPHGLQGTDIPLAARMFALADVWDALTSDRPYRKSWSHHEVSQYMRDMSGSLFDPELVSKFLEICPEKIT